jgi:putative NADH-flavin reductase
VLQLLAASEATDRKDTSVSLWWYKPKGGEMKIIIFGASGMIGQRLLSEAVSRGHEITAVARDPSKIRPNGKKLTVKSGDVLNPKQIASLIEGNDVVINATSPGSEVNLVVSTAESLITSLKDKKNVRLLIVGGAGSLEIQPGVQLVDSSMFPQQYKEIALAHRNALGVYRSSKINWTYLSPPIIIEPGQRSGHYRVGGDQLLKNEKGESKISAEDYAVAMLDEIEKPKHERTRFTVAY